MKSPVLGPGRAVSDRRGKREGPVSRGWGGVGPSVLLRAVSTSPCGVSLTPLPGDHAELCGETALICGSGPLRGWMGAAWQVSLL